MIYVIDTSVAFKWVVNELDSPRALLLRDDYRNGIHVLCAPDLFPSEIANSLLIAERRGRMPSGRSSQYVLEIVNTLPIIHAALPNLLPRAQTIATQIGGTVYDSLYVALAEQQKCELITADDKLVRKSQPAFSFVRALATLP